MATQRPASTPSPLSPEVAELAARHELGELRAAFAPQRLGIMMFALYLFTLTYLLILVIPALLLFLWLRRYPNFSRKQASKRLYLFDDGMIMNPQSADGLIVLRWDSVQLYTNVSQKIINGIPGPITYVYTLLPPTGGASATLTEFYERPGAWGPWIQEAVVRAQGSTALGTVLEGRTIRFGNFEVSRTGITAGGRDHLLWADFQRIDVENGRVHIMKTGDAIPWSRSDVKSIANLAVLLTLAENLDGRRTTGP